MPTIEQQGRAIYLNELSEMTGQLIRVECYSGHKAEERPVRIVFEAQTLEIAEVEDRWYSPGATYFRVLAESGDRYVLRRDDAQ